MVLVKKCEGSCRGSVLMVKIAEGDYSSSRYVISDSRFFDNNRQADFFDSCALQITLAEIRMCEVESAGRP
jgi:hypothetical protein